MAVQILNEQNFDQVISNNKLVFIDFSAVWCRPCQSYKPKFHAFAEEHEGQVVCGSIDIDECRSIAMRFGIQAVPTTVIIKDGEPADNIVGAIDKAQLEAKLAAHS